VETKHLINRLQYFFGVHIKVLYSIISHIILSYYPDRWNAKTETDNQTDK